MVKYTLRFNENLNIEILELYYEQNLTVDKIWKKIKRKICKNSIYSIVSEHKLYKEFKEWAFGFK